MDGRWGQQFLSTWNGHESEVYYSAPITCHCVMTIYRKFYFKMMLLGLQCPLTQFASFSCCMSFRLDGKYWSKFVIKVFNFSFDARPSRVHIDFTFEYVLNGFLFPLTNPSYLNVLFVFVIEERYLQLVNISAASSQKLLLIHRSRRARLTSRAEDEQQVECEHQFPNSIVLVFS